MTAQPYQLMPPLSAEEYVALRDDIAERGVLVPVVRDQYGNLLDGHHRAAIAAELGIEYPSEVRQVADDAEARSLARTYNLARRHLTREQKRALVAEEIQADPDRSDRAIGRLLGCDHKTVGSVRRELSGEFPHPAAPLTPEEHAEFGQLEAVIEEGLRMGYQNLVEAVIRRKAAPAFVAQKVRQFRAEYREKSGHRFGDDYAPVDDILFAQPLDFLGAAQVLAGDSEWRIPADDRAVIWLEAWAESRPEQHAREIQLWAEAAAGLLDQITHEGENA